MEANTPRPGAPQFQVIQSATRPKDSTQAHVAAGPFPTKAAAEAWVSAQTSPSLPGLPNPLSFLSLIGNVGHWIGVFVAAVTDVHLYISLGWLLLGLVLLTMGLILWLRTTDAYKGLSATAKEAGVAAAAA